MDTIQNKSEDYFEKNITILEIFGISLKGRNTLPYRIYSFVILNIVFANPLLSVPDMFRISYDDMIKTMFVDSAYLVSTIKVLTLYMNRKKFLTIIRKLDKKPFLADVMRGGPNEKIFIQEFLSINKNQARVYYGLAILFLTFVGILTLIRRLSSSNSEEWSPLNFKYVVVNITYSPNYELSFVHQHFAWIAFVIFFAATDLLLTGVLCNVRCQLKILQNYIRSMPAQSFKPFPNNGPSVHLKSQDDPPTNELEHGISKEQLTHLIKTAVDYHIEIINLIQGIEDVFSISLIMVFISILGMVGTLTYVMSTLLITDPELWLSLVEVLYVLLQLLLTCYWCEEVRNESYCVGDAAWDICVAVRDERFQKAMNMIILRSRIPIKLTAGKVTNIGMATMTWTLRASYSIFMVLRNVRLQ